MDPKKHKYQQGVLDVEVGSFTPLVFGTTGEMGNQCQHFLKYLTHKIAQKFLQMTTKIMFEVHFFFPHRASNIMQNLISFCSASFNSFLVMTFIHKSLQACINAVNIQ